MNKRMLSKAFSLYSRDDDMRVFSTSIAISLICHLVVLVVVIFSPIRPSVRKFSPAIINVDLVSLPSRAPTRQNDAKQESQVKTEKKKKKSPTVKAKPVKNVKPYKKSTQIVKKSLKKKTYKRKKVKKSALNRLEKDIEKSKPDHLSKAFDRLKDKVSKSATAKGIQEMPGISGIAQQTIASQLTIYKAEIYGRIRKNWAFSEQLIGGVKTLETRLVIKIMPDGEIRDVWFERKSGNKYLDESAYKTVKKSNPLPELPKSVRPYYELELRFNPSGLR